MDVLIKNGTLVTMDKGRRTLKNFSIGVTDGRITEIAPQIKGEADFVIDASKKIVLPGLINAHTHLPMTLLRGVADDLPLDKWLGEVIWPIEAGLEDKHVYAGSLLGCLEMVKTGTTCFNDMYFFLDEISKAVGESGIRGVLSWAMIDGGDEEKGKRLADEGERLIKKFQQANKGKRGGRVYLFLGPHAPYTCSEGLLVRSKDLAAKYKTGVHIHVAETKKEVEDSVKTKGKRPFEFLDSIGFLGSNVVAAHATYASKKEIGILNAREVKVAHNPTCNMKLASGVASVPEYVDGGVVVALGTDGPASNNNLDMFEDMKICALLHKVNKGDPSAVPALQVLEFATINGAKALGLDGEIGSLEVGKRADIIMVDTEAPNLTPLTNPISHLVYAARGSDVDTVLVDGKILMENRQCRTLDQGEVLQFAREQAKDLLNKAGQAGKLF